MGPILLAEIEQGGRLCLNVRQNDGAMKRIDHGDQVMSEGLANHVCVVGLPTTFKISNYHFSDNYAVLADNGVVSVVEDVVTYVPSIVGTGGFWLNGSFISATVIEDRPYAPTITYPTEGLENTILPLRLMSSNYQAANPSLVHYQTQWQIALDSNFTNIVMDVTTDLELEEIDASGLSTGRWYYVRCRHIGMK